VASSVIGIILQPINSGTGSITLSDIKLLRNDGQGSSMTVSSTGQQVTISAAATDTIPLPPTISFISPESFVPVIATSADIFSGKYFLVFSTTDKGSGINHYEVLEVSQGKNADVESSWHTATSPYLLEDQNLSSDIYVRAVDNAGNSIVAKLPASSSLKFKIIGYENIALAIILIFIIITLLFFIRKRWRMVR
jgi:hypothetical protein